MCLPFRFQKVLEVAQASGEHEKIMQGLYENYLESKAKDPRMEGASILSERIFINSLAKQQMTAHGIHIGCIWLNDII